MWRQDRGSVPTSLVTTMTESAAEQLVDRVCKPFKCVLCDVSFPLQWQTCGSKITGGDRLVPFKESRGNLKGFIETSQRLLCRAPIIVYIVQLRVLRCARKWNPPETRKAQRQVCEPFGSLHTLSRGKVTSSLAVIGDTMYSKLGLVRTNPKH